MLGSLLSYTHTHTHTLSLSLTHTHTLSLTHTHSLSLTHTHSLFLSLSHTHSLSLSHTYTHTVCNTLLFRCISGCKNAPQWYIIRTLPVLLVQDGVTLLTDLVCCIVEQHSTLLLPCSWRSHSLSFCE